MLSRPSFKLQFKFLLVDTYIGDKSQHYAMQFTCGYRKTVLQTKPFFPYKKEKGMAKKNELKFLDTNESTVPCVLGVYVVSLCELSIPIETETAAASTQYFSN